MPIGALPALAVFALGFYACSSDSDSAAGGGGGASAGAAGDADSPADSGGTSGDGSPTAGSGGQSSGTGGAPADPPETGPLPEGNWEPAGEKVLDLSGFAHSLTVYEGLPYAAVPQSDGSALVARFEEGKGWVEVFDPIDLGGAEAATQEAELRFGSDGKPRVATIEYPGGPSVTVYAGIWNGSDWVGLGGSAKLTGKLFTQSFDVELVGDAPHVLHTSQPGDTATHAPTVRRFLDGAWDKLEAPTLEDSRQRSLSSDLSVAPDGTTYLAWTEKVGEAASPTNLLVLSRLDGDQWKQLGTPRESLFGPAVLARNDRVVVASSASANDQITVSSYDEGWIDWGAPFSAGDGSIRDLGISQMSNGAVVVAWSELVAKRRRVFVRGFDGEQWVSIGEAIDGTGDNQAAYPRIATDGETLWLSWVDTPDPSQSVGVVRAAQLTP